MPKGKYRTARNVGFSSERLAPCIYRILAARAYFHGSSPRMWGTRPAVRAVVERERFIPTHVGNTGCPGARPGVPPVHPHARGAHLTFDEIKQSPDGSSPRTWGTRARHLTRLVMFRFIPTHVGNTGAAPDAVGDVSVHPHARGEHTWPNCRCHWTTGSSPRAWGTPPYTVQFALECRFIPTHVGNTRSLSGGRRIEAVHPHARGEHTAETTAARRKIGSSPRTWGTRTRCCRVGYPAPVHPHARGEHCSTVHPNAMSRGSSPRTWGTPDAGSRSDRGERFIPTHVGNTEDE